MGVAIVAFSLVWNVSLMLAGRALYAERADLTRALIVVGTTDPLPPGVDPNLNLVLVPSPVQLRSVLATYGSPMADRLAPGLSRRYRRRPSRRPRAGPRIRPPGSSPLQPQALTGR